MTDAAAPGGRADGPRGGRAHGPPGAGSADGPDGADGPWPDLDLVLDAVFEAGRVIMTYFATDTEVRHKTPDQPVTDADLAADRLLRERLLAGRPGYGWLSEETADSPARLDHRRVWIVDPIDGTRSFIAGYREFGVSVALVEDGEPLVGVIQNPATREVFWAVRGGGAFRARDWAGGRGGAERLAVDEAAAGAAPALLASRTEIARGELGPFRGDHLITPRGSTAYKLAGVATGGGYGLVSQGPKREWDIAAGALIVEEAGGLVTDVSGQRRTYNQRETHIRGLVAGPPGLHARLLETLSRSRGGE